jgi:hypothetical protein
MPQRLGLVLGAAPSVEAAGQVGDDTMTDILAATAILAIGYIVGCLHTQQQVKAANEQAATEFREQVERVSQRIRTANHEGDGNE